MHYRCPWFNMLYCVKCQGIHNNTAIYEIVILAYEIECMLYSTPTVNNKLGNAHDLYMQVLNSHRVNEPIEVSVPHGHIPPRCSSASLYL